MLKFLIKLDNFLIFCRLSNSEGSVILFHLIFVVLPTPFTFHIILFLFFSLLLSILFPFSLFLPPSLAPPSFSSNPQLQCISKIVLCFKHDQQIPFKSPPMWIRNLPLFAVRMAPSKFVSWQCLIWTSQKVRLPPPIS